MSTGPARLAAIVVGGAAEPWTGFGFAVDASGRAALANGAIELAGGDRHGIVALAVAGVDDLPDDVDGVPVRSAGAEAPASAADHPNGAFELDHVVVMTDSIERTSAAVQRVLGLELRRVREAGPVRQAFHRFADEPAGRGCILEVVERPDLVGAELWGFVVNVGDLDATVASLGHELVGEPRDAVQPGRRIASARRGAGLGVPVALMTPS